MSLHRIGSPVPSESRWAAASSRLIGLPSLLPPVAPRSPVSRLVPPLASLVALPAFFARGADSAIARSLAVWPSVALVALVDQTGVFLIGLVDGLDVLGVGQRACGGAGRS